MSTVWDYDYLEFEAVWFHRELIDPFSAREFPYGAKSIIARPAESSTGSQATPS